MILRKNIDSTPFIAMQAEYLTVIMSLTSILLIMRTWFSTFMPVSKAPIL